jgi:hypothetical protein
MLIADHNFVQTRIKLVISRRRISWRKPKLYKKDTKSEEEGRLD